MYSQLNFTRLIKNIWGLIPFLIGLFFGLYFITLRITDISLTYFPGDLGDGRLNLYFLEHAYKFFTGQVKSFWDAPFMYPESNVITYSDNLLGSAPIYSIFRIFGFDIFTSYQCWFIVLAILNYSTSYLFLNKLFKNNYAAVLGAMIFAFSMALQSQITHAQTFPRFAIPLAFLMAINFKEELNPKFFFFTLLFVVYQIYCGIYLGFMLAIPIAVFLIILFLINFNTVKIFINNKKWVFQMLGSLIISFLLVLPLILPYLQRKITPSIGNYNELIQAIPTVKSHFFSQHGSLIWNFLSKTGSEYQAWWDHQSFAGGIATICLMVFTGMLLQKLYKSKISLVIKSIPICLLITGIITKLLYIRFGNISAYVFVYFLPGYSSMRSITRIINIELIFFAIATAFIFSRILKKENRWIFLLFLLFTGLIIIDNYFKEGKSYRTEKRIALERINPIIDLIEKLPENAIISYEPQIIDSLSIYYHIDAMLASQYCNLKTINGYTATCPIDFSRFWDNINENSRNHWLSNKNIAFDTLFVIKSALEYEPIQWSDIPISEGQNENSNSKKLNNLINYIRTDEKWMKQIRKKAEKKDIPVDSMLKLDAIWVLENEDK